MRGVELVTGPNGEDEGAFVDGEYIPPFDPIAFIVAVACLAVLILLALFA